jgi:hypothetical protein
MEHESAREYVSVSFHFNFFLIIISLIMEKTHAHLDRRRRASHVLRPIGHNIPFVPVQNSRGQAARAVWKSQAILSAVPRASAHKLVHFPARRNCWHGGCGCPNIFAFTPGPVGGGEHFRRE